jgi:hypothetical protein
VSRQPEAKFYARIKPVLVSLPRSHVYRITQVSVRGTPDVLMCLNGFFVSLELKRSAKATMTRLQARNIYEDLLCGGYANVVCPENFSEVLVDLNRIAAANKQETIEWLRSRIRT